MISKTEYNLSLFTHIGTIANIFYTKDGGSRGILFIR